MLSRPHAPPLQAPAAALTEAEQLCSQVLVAWPTGLGLVAVRSRLALADRVQRLIRHAGLDGGSARHLVDRTMLRRLGMIGALLLLAGCAGPLTTANSLASRGALHYETVDADTFVLSTYQRLTAPGKPLRIYIEGDGLAWISRYQPSLDPTPHNPVALRLAVVDPGANVVYLARPCQYTPMPDNPRCTVDYWTGKRFAPEVITSLNQAVDHYVAQAHSPGVELVGYSGGGALAVLLAARRTDVLSLRTVAGNLDHAEVNRRHAVSLMPDSLNAIDVAQRVANIPQYHFSGASDRTVPSAIAERFAKVAGGHCIQLLIIPDMAHDGNWSAQWQRLLAYSPSCK